MSARALLTEMWKMQHHKCEAPSEPLLPVQPFIDELGPVGLIHELLYWGAMERTTTSLVQMPRSLFTMLPPRYVGLGEETIVDGIRVTCCAGNSVQITFTPYAPEKWVPQSPLQTDPRFSGWDERGED